MSCVVYEGGGCTELLMQDDERPLSIYNEHPKHCVGWVGNHGNAPQLRHSYVTSFWYTARSDACGGVRWFVRGTRRQCRPCDLDLSPFDLKTGPSVIHSMRLVGLFILELWQTDTDTGTERQQAGSPKGRTPWSLTYLECWEGRHLLKFKRCSSLVPLHWTWLIFLTMNLVILVDNFSELLKGRQAWGHGGLPKCVTVHSNVFYIKTLQKNF